MKERESEIEGEMERVSERDGGTERNRVSKSDCHHCHR